MEFLIRLRIGVIRGSICFAFIGARSPDLSCAVHPVCLFPTKMHYGRRIDQFARRAEEIAILRLEKKSKEMFSSETDFQ